MDLALSAAPPGQPPIVQYVHRPGLVDLGWGHPDPVLLPVEAWQRAMGAALRELGWQALTYGHAQGPGPLLAWLGQRLGEVDGRPPAPDEILITAGASQALDLVASAVVKPGDVVLVESPTYHLALRILEDHGASRVAAPCDDAGIDPAATAARIDELRRLGRRVSMIYLVPTFGNPTGRSLSVARRRALAELGAATGILVVEDDTYRELSYGPPAPASVWSHDAAGSVARLGSFSKTVAPGLRLGWITASAGLIRRLAGSGMLDSGGGLNHTTALAMAAFGASGDYGRHLEGIRSAYRSRRDALAGALATQLPELGLVVPEGGWFLWLRLPAGLSSAALLAAAEACGVSFLTGPRFFTGGGGDDRIRLAFSLFAPEILVDAVDRLRRAFEGAAARG